MKRHAFCLPILLILSLTATTAQDTGAEEAGPSLNIYPSFHVKFAPAGKNYLLASLVVVNVSGREIRNVSISQEFPDEFVPAPAPDGIHDYVDRPQGFEESIQGQTYTMKIPLLRRREMTTGFSLLTYHGRPGEAQLPAAKAVYTAAGKEHTEQGPSLRLELGKYTKYSGSLSDFVKRYATLTLKVPQVEGADWGFSSLASKMRAKTPVGMVEIDGDSSEGRFSVLSGAPGETREMLVAWRPAAKAKPSSAPEDIKKLVGDQIFSGSDFTLDLEAAKVEKRSFARGQALVLDSRWKDRVAARLGEGPIRWYLYDDPEKKEQFLIMIRAQGRGAGPGKADVPNPDKEAALMNELEGMAQSLRPM